MNKNFDLIFYYYISHFLFIVLCILYIYYLEYT